MKTQKLLATSGLLLSLAFLAGCGSNPVATTTPAPTAKPVTEAPATTPATIDNSTVALPADVSTQPATTPADEAKNIDKDLKAMDASNGQDSISNKDLGL